MRCEGLPNGPCPFKRKGVGVVNISQGDMMLCQHCNDVRFGPKRSTDINTDNTVQNSNTDVETNVNEVNENSSTSYQPNQVIIIDTLLSYAVFSFQNSSFENIKAAILGHFTTENIIQSKALLWTKCDNNIIGERARRKDSLGRSEKEAHVIDILTAIEKLDKADRLPMIADCQQLIKENKRIKAGLKMLLDERERLLSENANLNEGVEKFHGQIQDLHILLSRVDELEAENKDLKNDVDKLQTEVENIRKEIIRKDQENQEKLQFLKESHKDELRNLKDQMTATADYEKNILQEKISKNEKEILGLQMEKNQLQAQKETELTELTQEYETKLDNLQRQKLQQHQNKINQQNQELFRKKLQHMKDEYEKEIKGLKRTIEDYQIGSRPSPRSRERLTLTTVGGKKRKS